MAMVEDTPEQTKALAAQFLACGAELRNWVEQQGYQALDARIASGNAIGARVTGLLTVLLGAMAAAGSLAVKVFEPAPAASAWGAAALCGYLMLLVAHMVRTVIMLGDAPPARARPALLAMPGRTLEEVKSGELARVDERIRQQSALNTTKAAALNRIYAAAAAGPMVFVLGCLAAWAWRL